MDAVPQALVDTATQIAASSARGPDEAALFLRFSHTLGLDLDPATGARVESSTCTVLAVADATFAEVASWEEVAALVGGRSASPSPWPVPRVAASERTRARQVGEALLTAVAPAGGTLQAAIVRMTRTFEINIRGRKVSSHVSSTEQAQVRCEFRAGAVVDGVAAAVPGAPLEFEALAARLKEAALALEGPGAPADRSLPVVFRPLPAASLVTGLAWALRGDVAASTPALARSLGRKVFPSVLTVEDDPLASRGMRRRTLDEEGTASAALTLVREGRLEAFAHTLGSAAATGQHANGRATRDATGRAEPGFVNLAVVPGTHEAPADHLEITCRLETFTPMSRPGVLDLSLCGFEVRNHQRVRALAPFDCELQVLPLFRALTGVGADLAFFPTLDGCGTPSLIYSPLFGLGGVDV